MSNSNKKIWLYDTTLRDGTQMEGISLSAHDKVMIAQRLDEFGMHYIEGGWPGSNPKDMVFFEEIRKVPIKNAKIAAFGSTRRANTKIEEDESYWVDTKPNNKELSYKQNNEQVSELDFAELSRSKQLKCERRKGQSVLCLCLKK